MFDSQPKMVFMENFRWSTEALSQQNLQLWNLELTSTQTPKAKAELWDRLLKLVYVQIFLAINFVFLY